MIPVYKGGSVVAYAKVSPEDVELVSQYHWTLHSQGYAITSKGRGKNGLLMHRLLLDVKLVDHKDGDKLNNVRGNLRELTRSLNAHNSDKSKGCYYDNSRDKWRAHIRVDGKRKWLGSFDTEEEAHRAHLEAKEKLLQNV